MKELIRKLEESTKGGASDKKVGSFLKRAVSNLKMAHENSDSADAIVFQSSVALADVASALFAIAKEHKSRELTKIAADIKGAASDLSTKGRSAVKSK
jgi:hypothetical protein